METVSLQDIIMESWTGSRVYKLTLKKPQQSNSENNSAAAEQVLGSATEMSSEIDEEVAIEI